VADPVVIVGAGPVGLTLALELARFEVPAVVLDRKPGLEQEGSRAIVIARHTLETFARLGCAQPMVSKAVAIARARTYFRETELFCVEFPPARDGELPRFVNLQQTHTERALLRAVEAAPSVDLRWGAEATGLDADDRGVVLALASGGRIRGSYVVGCDGAGSAVRKLLGIPFHGRTFPERFLIADIRADLDFPHERRFFFDPPSNPGRQVLIHPQPDREWRIDWQVPEDTDAEAERASGQLDGRIRAIIGEAEYELVWLTAYRFHERVAERFRAGRGFLAGDAAHLYAPFGARGMNSGVEDARNLGWRLALALVGEAPATVLDGYERERLPAARENLRVTSATMRFMAPPTAAHRLLRNALLRASLPVPALRRFVDSGKLAVPAVYGGAGGDRFVGRLVPPDARVREAGPVRGFGVAALGERGLPYVVRPDGYVAAVLPDDGDATIAAAVRSALGAGVR
jgi:2-polyprenyl-6-methoxyphenol hydroxylase-like FAD-dependent oxidoreductase